ncbi:MAG TPA: excinuclease ABC subunit UvrC [Dictyoglomaceae bacterium]|nr:excinuclease ABC subunit UvrC [Dictyoglomaceae bacterium]HOL39127.1 excinuclease ABC subunit UvrC [Dictyoglomaceae bacterium]HPP15281.1 excinuclease ABC subunit UvrC [Dictyoglomaceae bacterium]HPU42687.1 excinuclease ABC subunit UvrC [Dictyoglomaceae bacterium]
MEEIGLLIKEKAERFPESPGVYLFYDSSGNVLYVGKAKNLKKRIASYFSESSSLKAAYLLRKSSDLNYIVTDSETEALLLEAILIKKHRPMMNVQLKDDKQYPLLKLTLNEEYPRLILARRVEEDGAKYFGPYPQGGTVRETISIVKKLFNLRTCSWNLPKNKPKRPCLNYYIGNCKAPCQGYMSKEEYWGIVDDVSSFLEGKYQAIIEKFTKEMNEYAKNLEFEKAANVRDKIKVVQNLGEKQKIFSLSKDDKDLIQYYIEDHRAKILVYLIREGKLIERRIFSLNIPYSSDKVEILESFMLQYYSQREIPNIVVIPFSLSPETEESLGKFLSNKKGMKVFIRTPENEDEEKLLEMALKDLNIESLKTDKVWIALLELQKIFGLEDIPTSIEGYDISNLQGKEAVGSRVYFYKGYPDKNKYRRYKIKNVEETPNDYLMLQEVFRRRLGNIEEDPLPDIILIDGGKGQLNSVLEIFSEMNIKPKGILALAKEREEIFLPGKRSPLLLPKDSPPLLLLEHVRDEAHRFAVSYHRKVHKKKLLDSTLLKIPGVGEKRLKILLDKFSSLENIKNASLEELKEIPSIPENLAEKIYHYFHQ